MNLDTVAWILGTDIALVSIATVFASAWIRVTRIDKLEENVERLRERFNKVEVLESKIIAIENGIEEIKLLIREQRDRNV